MPIEAAQKVIAILGLRIKNIPVNTAAIGNITLRWIPNATRHKTPPVMYLSSNKRAIANKIKWQANPLRKPLVPKVKNIKEAQTNSIPIIG